MQSSEAELYDLAIIGGGISGLGVAIEAGKKGLKCVVIEKGACLSGTSNNSLRIIHGGFRYLQNLDIRRTIASLKEQALLLDRYSQYIRPLPCAMPLNRIGLKSKYPAALACKLYNSLYQLSSGADYKEARLISSSHTEKNIPVLRGLAPHGALLWQDGLIVDLPGLHACIINQSKSSSTDIIENATVLHFEKHKAGFTLSYQTGERVSDIKARIVVNAAGPWVSAVRETFNGSAVAPHSIRWCRAFNLVVDKQLESEFAFGLMSGEGRLFFTAPRDEGSAIGTFYLPPAEDPKSAKVVEREIIEALESFNSVLPSAGLSLANISSIDSGVLPLNRMQQGKFILQGNEQILAESGYIEIISTKYTTFRRQASKVMKLVDKEMHNALKTHPY